MNTSGQGNLSAEAKADYGLVLRGINGDQRAYTKLMDRYRKSIYHMMYKMTSNREDAEDLTLEAFGKAFNKLSSYAPRYAFSTRLFKIAINNCISHTRKKRLHMLSIDDPIGSGEDHDYSSNLKSTADTPEEILISEQRKELVSNILQKLNHKHRLIIELRFFEELSYDEIAKELDIPLGTVKAQLFRAKEILYNYLQQPGALDYLESTKRKVKRKKQPRKNNETKFQNTADLALGLEALAQQENITLGIGFKKLDSLFSKWINNTYNGLNESTRLAIQTAAYEKTIKEIDGIKETGGDIFNALKKNSSSMDLK